MGAGRGGKCTHIQHTWAVGACTIKTQRDTARYFSLIIYFEVYCIYMSSPKKANPNCGKQHGAEPLTRPSWLFRTDAIRNHWRAAVLTFACPRHQVELRQPPKRLPTLLMERGRTRVLLLLLLLRRNLVSCVKRTVKNYDTAVTPPKIMQGNNPRQVPERVRATHPFCEHGISTVQMLEVKKQKHTTILQHRPAHTRHNKQQNLTFVVDALPGA